MAGSGTHTAGTRLLDAALARMWGAADRLLDLYWEKRLGIDTAGHVAVDYPDARPYMTLHYRIYLAMLRRCGPGGDDVVVDAGCGKGRVLCCAARFPVRRVVGVEIDPQLCAAARRNAARMRGRRAPVEVVTAAAQDFDYREATIVIMFNPFGPQTLRKVVGRIEQSLHGNPRRLRMVYFNPVHEDLLACVPWLRRYEHWPARLLTGMKFAVSFWQTTGR